MIKSIVWGVVGVAVGVILTVVLASVVGGNSQPQNPLGSGTRFPNGLSADTTSPSAGEVRGTTFTATGALSVGTDLTVGDDVDAEGTVTTGTTYASSTSAGSATLSASEIQGYTAASFFPTVGALTLTFPASSTITTSIPNSGDRTSWLIHNSTTTEDIKITLAEGTGWQFGTTTGSVALEIKADHGAVLDCYRKATTDIFCHVDN